ncbi:MAG: ATP-binding protein [Deltaproteobacteria bacterium]|nr:ATP-binding protein [Deltaproteobacteria bacterium]MBN2673596.1 ATP-binding protein [Deltaproteobacteria bacterium]
MKREIFNKIVSDLQRKIVFLSGPRQVGKTYLSRNIMSKFEKPRYLNYDNLLERKVVLGQGWSVHTDLLVLDEIHKMPDWKNYLKGVWDSRTERLKILVTGSARLEVFRQSGDSLAGRYFHHRLLPVTLAEAATVNEQFSLSHLINRGGFPEPLLASSDDDAGRWRRLYADGLIREDILTIDNIHQFKAMTLLVELLRLRVASPLSYQSLAEDIGVAPNTVKHYIDILEALYIVFRVYPFHRSITRSIRKQPKFYFFDNGMVKGDEGAMFENLVAVSLLRQLYLLEDRDGKRRQLFYLRTREGKEVDFLVAEEDQPILMVEAKNTERRISQGLSHFSKKYGYKGVQVVRDLNVENESGILHLRRADEWLKFEDILN